MDDRTWAFLEAIKNMATSIAPIYATFENEKFRPDLVSEMKRMEMILRDMHSRIKKSGSWGIREKEQYISIDKRMDAILDIGAEG